MDYIAQFGRYMQAERRASPATVVTYTADLREFERYVLGQDGDREEVFLPERITLSDIRAWIMALSERGIAPVSINRKITTLRCFYRYLLRQGVVEQSPALKIRALRVGRRLPHFVDEGRMAALVRVLEEPSEEFSVERDATVVLLLYACGLRRAELSSLSIGDLDPGGRNLRVMGKGRRERLLPLLPAIATRLEHYLHLRTQETLAPGAEEALFITDRGRALTGAGVYAIVKRYLGDAGIQGKRSPHVLRHTFATHLMQHGVSVRTVQQLLGHKSLAATQIYTHNTIESLKTVYRTAHPRAVRE